MKVAAQRLTGTALTVDDISRRVGYAAASHFSRAFSIAFNESPGRCRRLSGRQSGRA